MKKLFTDLFGPDYCDYQYTKAKTCVLVPGQFPNIVYRHCDWEKAFPSTDSPASCGDKVNSGSRMTVKAISSPSTEKCASSKRSIRGKKARSKVLEETNWLGKFHDADATAIGTILKESCPQDEILRQGSCIMDTRDFSTLACERYVTGFTIDVICLKLLEHQTQSSAIYLPSYTQTWARQGLQFLSQRIKPFFPPSHSSNINYILTTIHDRAHQHWGMVCLHIPLKTVFYDDGLKASPPDDTVTVARTIIQASQMIAGTESNIVEDEWNCALPFPRFNMPVQTQHGVGSGSCGVGVILAVRDFIRYDKNDLPNFAWKYENMSELRKQLMVQVLKWRNEGH